MMHETVLTKSTIRSASIQQHNARFSTHTGKDRLEETKDCQIQIQIQILCIIIITYTWSGWCCSNRMRGAGLQLITQYDKYSEANPEGVIFVKLMIT
jgi:hypothetical protein